jgi:glucan endo-1,3-alpha-glucosidase
VPYFSILKSLVCISDAIALNMGGDSWEAAQVASAYAAAKALGTTLKLFISFDFTAMGCTLSNVASLVNTYANHPNQFKYNGKTFISSYEGGCLGNAGWQSLKAQTNGYVMPLISGIEGQFSQWSALDSWYWLVRFFFDENIRYKSNLIVCISWGCAWPQGDYDKNVRRFSGFPYILTPSHFLCL